MSADIGHGLESGSETRPNGAGLVLAVDAMGGDHGPTEVVAGVAMALREGDKGAHIILVGDQPTLEKLLLEHGLRGDARVELVHASEVIGMDEKPMAALKQKKDSSMSRAIDLVKAGRAQGVLSLGNTGALLAGGALKLRPMAGIERPALASVIPSRGHRWVLIDAGANPDAAAIHLLHNALLGKNYARCALGMEHPRVGLLTIGTEEGKGSEKVVLAHTLLKAANGVMNYTGLVEGFQLFRGEVDVVVCDGFTGNVLLKTLESCFSMLKDFLKDELKANPLRMAGALLAKGAFDQVKKELSPEELGGAPLLGLTRLVIKAHGSSTRGYVAGAVRIAMETLAHDLTGSIRADLEKLEAAGVGVGS
ncbi:MAG: phosphate acyltransferase PlsX [Opitutales bacterium]